MPLDPDAFREEKGGDLKKIRDSQAARGKPPTQLENVLALDDQWRKKRFEVDEIQKKKNKLDKSFKEAAADQKPTLQEESKKLKAAIAQGDEDANELLRKRDIAIGVIGNLVHESVPVSKDEKDNEVKWTWGKTERTGNEMSHHEVLHRIAAADLEKGVVVAGHRGYFLKGWGVRLNQALISYGLDFLREYKYTEVQPPFFMKKEVMAETAQLEEFDEALYKVVGNKSEDGKSNEEFYLIATSEQPISALHRGDVLEDKDLPIRYAGISSCFRKEAGSHGKDTWGIFRIHQFEKVEQFCITTPEKSWEMHEEMIAIARKFYESLGLSYRVVTIVSGELNNAAAKKYDLEAWFPNLGTFRELVSASNCTDYQSRAMGTKYGFKKQGEKDKNRFVHMLNATLCATERTICCILENYQRENGVEIPKVLQKYMNAEFIPYTRERPVNINKIKQDRAAEKEAKKGKGGKDKAAKADGAADVKDEKPAGKGKNKGGDKDKEAKSDAPKEEGKKGGKGKGGKNDSQNAAKDAAPKTEESPKSAEPKQESGKKGGKGKNKGGNKDDAPKEEAPKAAAEESKPAEDGNKQGKGKGKKQSQQKEVPKESEKPKDEKPKEETPKTEAKEQGGSKKNKGNKQQSKGSDASEAPKAAEAKPEDSPKKEEGGKGGKGKNKQGGGKQEDKPKEDAGSATETQTPRKDSAASTPAKKGGESGKKEESKKAESTPKKEEPKPEAKDTKPAEPKQESGKKEQPKQGGGNQQQGGGSGKKKNKKK